MEILRQLLELLEQYPGASKLVALTLSALVVFGGIIFVRHRGRQLRKMSNEWNGLFDELSTKVADLHTQLAAVREELSNAKARAADAENQAKLTEREVERLRQEVKRLEQREKELLAEIRKNG